MLRLYVPGASWQTGDVVSLTVDQAHYALRVRRLNAGDTVTLLNGDMGAWLGTLQGSGKQAAVLISEQIQQPLTPPQTTLLLPLLARDAWRFALEKATELNVHTIQPVVTEFTQSKKLNRERTEAQLVEACQQCERTHVPVLENVQPLAALLKNWDADVPLVTALERNDAETFSTALKSLPAEPMAFLVGPEGGFSPQEKQQLQNCAFVKAVTLGNTILRVETAAIAMLSAYLLSR